MAQGEAAAGLHEPGVALGEGEGDAGGHDRPPAAAAQHRRLAGHQVGAGVAGPGVGGQRQVGVEPDHGDLQHAAIIAAPRLLDRATVPGRIASPSCSCGWTSR